MASSENISALLYPKAVAVIGASSAPRKAGGRRWLSLIQEGFSGEIFPINAKGADLNGYKTLKSVKDMPVTPDVAVIMVPSDAVFGVLRDCVERGARAVVMVSAGFGETGAEGKRVEAEMVAMCRASGTRLLGPNSAGVFSAGGALNCVGWKIPRGQIAVVSQSGNMAGTFTHLARAKGTGFASMIAVGNSADLRLSELIEALLDDPETRSILVYCEGFASGDGRRLVDVMRNARRRLPIVILKPGSSEAGQQAARSHTGSLAGEDAVVSAALAEAGIIRATETEEAFDLAFALSKCGPMQGNRIAVLSDGGGHATVVSDCAGRNGLSLAILSDDTRRKLADVLPVRSGIENPIDFAGFAESDPDCTAKILDICINDPNVDGAIFAGHFGGYHLMTDHIETQQNISKIETQAAADMVDIAVKAKKPFVLHSDHGERSLGTLAPMREAGIPIYTGLESSAKAMAVLSQWNAILRRNNGAVKNPLAPDQWEDREVHGGRVLTEAETRQRLRAAAIDVPDDKFVTSGAQAAEALRAFGVPVVMKLVSKNLVHKSDAGGVILNLCTEEDVRTAWTKLETLSKKLGDTNLQVMVASMIAKGTECIVGAKFDPQFGPLVLFGAGGILVELTKDRAIGLAPFSPDYAQSLIDQSLAGRLLRGFRGIKPVSTKSLCNILASISKLIANDRNILEIDLNPVIVNEEGAFIVDARMVVC